MGWYVERRGDFIKLFLIPRPRECQPLQEESTPIDLVMLYLVMLSVVQIITTFRVKRIEKKTYRLIFRLFQVSLPGDIKKATKNFPYIETENTVTNAYNV
jgi:hypothetical protein